MSTTITLSVVAVQPPEQFVNQLMNILQNLGTSFDFSYTDSSSAPVQRQVQPHDPIYEYSVIQGLRTCCQ